MRCTFAAMLLATVTILFAQAAIAQEDSGPPPGQPAAQDGQDAAKDSPDADPAKKDSESAPADKDPAEKDPAEKDVPKDEPKDGDAPSTAAGPKLQAWKNSLKQWKELLAKLRSLREAYTIAEKEDLDRIRKEYEDLRAEGGKKLENLKSSAREAFLESPNQDRELTRFLVQVAAQEVRADRYEDGYEASIFLIDNDCEDKRIYNWAGIAAYGTNRFAEAKKYLDMADEANVLTQPPDADGQSAHFAVDDVLATWKEEEKFLAAEAKEDPPLPRVRLKTSQGDIVLELFENEAPDTVGNFISLVEKGFYDGRKFFRVIPGFMAQVGSPTDDGKGGPGYNIPCECYKDPHRNHFAGSLSMAHAGRDTGGSQFYITFRPTPHLNGKHTVFGRVAEGMDVLAKIQRFEPDPQNPNKPHPEFDEIIEATVVNKRDHDYKPNKVK